MSDTPRTDAELVANQTKCPDGRLRCLDCTHEINEYCPGHSFGCGQNDWYRVKIVVLERELSAAQRAEPTIEAVSAMMNALNTEQRVNGGSLITPLQAIHALKCALAALGLPIVGPGAMLDLHADYQKKIREARIDALEWAQESAGEHECKTWSECCDCRGEIQDTIDAEIARLREEKK